LIAFVRLVGPFLVKSRKRTQQIKRQKQMVRWEETAAHGDKDLSIQQFTGKLVAILLIFFPRKSRLAKSTYVRLLTSTGFPARNTQKKNRS